jgi:hypothetical protein
MESPNCADECICPQTQNLERPDPVAGPSLFGSRHADVQGSTKRAPSALTARIAETLESKFAEVAESPPELLARHCTEAGVIEKAASLWGKAGQRSLERSALAEAAEQFKRALDLIAALPDTAALRRQAPWRPPAGADPQLN